MFRCRHHILRVHKISIKSTVGKLLLIKSRTFQLNNITLHPTVEAVPEQRASLTTEDEEQSQIPVVHELNPLLSQDDYEHEEISEVVGTEEDLLATATKNNYPDERILYPDLTMSLLIISPNMGNETIIYPNITESFNETQRTNDVSDVIFSSPESSHHSIEEDEEFFTPEMTLNSGILYPPNSKP